MQDSIFSAVVAQKKSRRKVLKNAIKTTDLYKILLH